MKKFVSHIIIFSAVMILINAALFFIGKKIYFGTYELHSTEFKDYILADSHGQALNGFAEKYGIFNFSYGSDSYDDMYRKILYLTRNAKPVRIFITADEHSLTSYRERKNNLDRSVYYCEQEDLGGYYGYFTRYFLKRYIPLLRPEIAEVIKIYKFPSEKKPVQWDSRSGEDRIRRAEKRVKTNFPEKGESEKLKRTLLDIINLCRKENIELKGIKFPLASEYLNAAVNESGSADYILRNNGVEVLDFSGLYIDNPEFFADQDHLNEAGAADLAEKLFGK